jgi:putative membrane protein
MWNCGNWGVGLPFGLGKYVAGLGPLGGILGLLLLLLILYFVIKLVLSFLPKTNAVVDKNDSLEILKNRFAKGEISPEEYQRMRELLLT